MNNIPLFIIISGNTSSGKDTIKHAFLKKFLGMKKIITTTTRPIRKNEVDGEDLHFITLKEFKKMENEGNFLETVEYAGNFYGTEKKEVLDNLNSDLIWRIDPSRAATVREMIRQHFSKAIAEQLLKRLIVFYIKIDENVARERLTQRGLEKSEIERRLTQDRQFWQKFHDKYDYIVENPQGKLSQTIEKVLEIIKNQRQENENICC